MSDNIDEIEDEEEDYYPHRHNFSALNYIKIKEPTLEELEAEKKKQQILESLSKYEMLFPAMHDLMFKAALDGEDLDKEYENLKHWLVFM